MSIAKLPSGRYRAQVWSSAEGKNVSVSRILGPDYRSFSTKAEAKAAREDARKQLGHLGRDVTVGQWFKTWTTDPLYRRPKQSTDLHNAERVKAFCTEHDNLQLRFVDDLVVARWLSGGKRNSQVPALRAMFSDAMSAKAGRLIDRNPWAGLRLARSRGNADKQPASEQMVWALVEKAGVDSPAFAAWLRVAAFTGMRPGELDALRWNAIDFEKGRIDIRWQFNSTMRTFTLPKNGKPRQAVLTPEARRGLLAIRETQTTGADAFCFTNKRGEHFTPSSRAFHWKAAKLAAGWDGSLYLATRHFAGWYMTNVLLLPSEDVAIALGHEDGGNLVRRLYGHRSREDALARAAAAYEQVGQLVDLNARRSS